MRTAIVSGANGFVGSELVSELLRQGWKVYALCRGGRSANIPKNDHVVIVPYDMHDVPSLSKRLPEKESYDIFYHLAWAGSSGEAREDYTLQLANARACADAAAFASAIGCRRFVGAGSVTQLMYDGYFKQDGSTPEMVACYAAGKIAAEYMTRCVCVSKGMEFIWIYISNFYGAGDHTHNFVNFLIQNYQCGITPALTDGRQPADFLYVTDVARALFAAGSAGISGSNYYVGYGCPRPLHQFVTTIRNIVSPGLETGLGQKPFYGMSVDFDQIDLTKLTRHTGFTPAISFECGIQKTCQWLKEIEG